MDALTAKETDKTNLAEGFEITGRRVYSDGIKSRSGGDIMKLAFLVRTAPAWKRDFS